MVGLGDRMRGGFMKEKISLIQMDVALGQVERNYEKAVQLTAINTSALS